ncbi:MAG: chorismate synthase [Clostridiales Family XIII bacterium]|jgi:chorismate synthase|nr:chorismate synthase [Clostridiales Family XIII bacterium]
MNTWGSNIRITLFGESHGSAVGAILDGVRPGLRIDEDFIAGELARRAPGRDEFSTARIEADEPRIISGVKDGYSTGAPIACIIENTNQHSGDYDSFLRPGHADLTGLLKYGRNVDRAGGGRFSGRLTAPLVWAGAICKLGLANAGIHVYGRIRDIAGAVAGQAGGIDLAGAAANADIPAIEKALARISGKPFPAADESEQLFKDAILAAKHDGDSVGGIIEVAVFGATAGLGEPFFGSVESTLSALYFSVPAVKGVEFGAGFQIANLRGSEANDPLRVAGEGEHRRVVSLTNNNGGILGGIANGMPLFARVAIKPTASIAKEQDTVDPGSAEEGKETRAADAALNTFVAPEEWKDVRAAVRGRHDPCILPRAVPVIEAVTAIGILDLLSVALHTGRRRHERAEAGK